MESRTLVTVWKETLNSPSPAHMLIYVYKQELFSDT